MTLTSGICIFRKSSLDYVGGWDERFRGYGLEDNAMTIQIGRSKLPIMQMPFRCYHIFHPRNKADGTIQHDHYDQNVQYLREHISNAYRPAAVIGDIHKYANET